LREPTDVNVCEGMIRRESEGRLEICIAESERVARAEEVGSPIGGDVDDERRVLNSLAYSWKWNKLKDREGHQKRGESSLGSTRSCDVKNLPDRLG